MVTGLQSAQLSMPSEAHDASSLRTASGEPHATAVALGRRMTLPQPIEVLAQDCCEGLAETVGARWSSFTKLGDDGDSLTTTIFGSAGAATSTDTALLKSSQSLASYAIRAACSLSVAKLGEDPRFKDHVLTRLGVVGALAIPLQVDDRSLGTLGIYTPDPRTFSDADISLSETIAQMLALTMAWRQSEYERQREAMTFDAVLDTTSELVAVLDPRGHLKRTNSAFQALSGYGASDVRDRHFCELFAAEDQIAGMKEAIAQAAKAQRRVFHESHLLDKHFARRAMLWTVSPVIDGADNLTELILAGVEVRPSPEANNANPHKAEHDQPRERRKAVTRPAVGREKRVFQRKAFGWTQMIAMRSGNSMPDRDVFFPVRCKDISAGGLSFFLDEEPTFRDIVVELGVPPQQKYMLAEIVRIEQTSENGKTCYVAGCSFRGHVSRQPG